MDPQAENGACNPPSQSQAKRRGAGVLSVDAIEDAIAAAGVAGKRRDFYDGLNGLVFRATASGSASWSITYRDAAGRRQRYTIGEWPRLKLTDARKLAKAWGAEIDKGADPANQRRVERREGAKPDARVTVRAWGEAWTSGQLAQRHAARDRMAAKASAVDDRYRLEAHVYPHIGTRPVAEVTKREVEAALGKAYAAAERKRGEPLRPATRWQIYQVMRRLFAIAIDPGELRSDNPVAQSLRPTIKEDKLFGYLYPIEALALLRCAAVPVGRRVLYAMAIYTGLREGSLLALTWADIDREHGTIRVLETKTGRPLLFAQRDPLIPGLQSVLAVLDRWRELSGRDNGPIVTTADIGIRNLDRLAKTLRADLLAAGIDRADLHGGDKVQPLRFHDLRATFATWAMRAGKGDGWICDRTGHQTQAMLNRYKRGAARLADLQYDPFPDISDVIGRARRRARAHAVTP